MKWIFFAYLCASCTRVQINDSTWYADKGPFGATQIHTLSSGLVSLSKADWDQKRLGMVCTDVQTFADIKKDIETLCSYTTCDYQMINSFFDRVGSAGLAQSIKK